MTDEFLDKLLDRLIILRRLRDSLVDGIGTEERLKEVQKELTRLEGVEETYRDVVFGPVQIWPRRGRPQKVRA